MLKAALTHVHNLWPSLDRLIVITDEQATDGGLPAWLSKSYMINVAASKNGVSYRNGWQHLDGWSERALDYIQALESEG